MLGNPMTEDIAALIAAMKNGPEEEQWTMEREECVAQLVQHCKQLLLTDEEECICGWALVDPFYRCGARDNFLLAIASEFLFLF